MAETTDQTSTAALSARNAQDVDSLLDLLNGTDRRGRISAARHLGEMREPRAVTSLVRILQGTDEVMKMAALKALGDIGESVAADAVFAAVADDPSPVVRSSAASALRALGDPRTVDILVSILAGEATGHAKRWAASEIVALDAVHALPAVEAAASRSSPFVAWCLRRSAKALRDKTGK